jgi:cytochrome c biogenesis factor
VTDDDSETGPVTREGRREVIVPPRLYKAVTVFSTLIAVAGVVLGFVLIDEATARATRPLAEVNVPLALLGLGLIVGSALQYAYAQRFRAAGMTTDKTGENGVSDDG